MSSDIYIPLAVVLSHPGQFELKAALNVDTIEAQLEILKDDPDMEWVRSCLEPVLLCKFGRRETWRHVEVFDKELHISCGGAFRSWLYKWLNDLGYKYTTLDDSQFTCYQCDKHVAWLAPDSRCKDCTHVTPDELKGEIK